MYMYIQAVTVGNTLSEVENISTFGGPEPCGDLNGGACFTSNDRPTSISQHEQGGEYYCQRSGGYGSQLCVSLLVLE